MGQTQGEHTNGVEAWLLLYLKWFEVFHSFKIRFVVSFIQVGGQWNNLLEKCLQSYILKKASLRNKFLKYSVNRRLKEYIHVFKEDHSFMQSIRLDLLFISVVIYYHSDIDIFAGSKHMVFRNYFPHS